MSYLATVYRVLVASPSDVVDERKAIPEILHQWNRDNSSAVQSVVEAVKWETHCTPEMGDRPQAIVNRQVVDDCDVLVGVFWTRLGSPTGKEDSGTVEEIRQFIGAEKPVLLYFSRMPVALDSVDTEQWGKLQAFKKECEGKGLLFSYDTLDELRDLLRSHLGRTIQKLNETRSDLPAKTAPGSREQAVSGDDAVRSFKADFDAFLRKAKAAWAAERDSEPYGLDEAKFLLGRLADDLIEYRSRIVKDNGCLSGLLSDATRNIKALQRHEVYMDGGASFNDFLVKGDDVLFLLEITSAFMDDALCDSSTKQQRQQERRAAVEVIEFNQDHLANGAYATAPTLRTDAVKKLLDDGKQLPSRLAENLREYVNNIEAARDLHQAIAGVTDDVRPELSKIDGHLDIAKSVGELAHRDLGLLMTRL